MDPDVARKIMIEKANLFLGLLSGGIDGLPDPGEGTTALDRTQQLMTVGGELAEAVHALDEWLRAGGFLPAVWTTQNPTGWPQIGRKKDVPS